MSFIVIQYFGQTDFSILARRFQYFGQTDFSILARRFQSFGQTNEGMADRENSMESPAPEEMPLVLAYPADGGPREQSPNVVLRALPPSVAVNMSTIFVGARVINVATQRSEGMNGNIKEQGQVSSGTPFKISSVQE